MYGLSQAGKLADDLSKKRSAMRGYHPVQFTSGLWRHVWQPVTFTLVVDSFGVNYIGKEHAEHLKMVLEQYYKITVDWGKAQIMLA